MLKNKNIIITGASTELGEQLATKLSLNNKLLLISRNKEKLIKIKKKLPKKNIDYLVIDYQNHNDFNDLKKKIDFFFNKKKGVHGVVHIAGGGLGIKSLFPTNEELFKMFKLNIFGAIQVNNIIIPMMKKIKRGNLVHVGSIASHEAVGSLSYNMAKASLNAYVRSLGKEIAQFGITVNGISPGGFIGKDNAMHRLKKNNIAAFKKFEAERLPRKKMGKIDEIIPFLIFLLSENSGMSNGCLIPLDAGEGKFYN